MDNVHDWMKDCRGSVGNVYDWRGLTKGLTDVSFDDLNSYTVSTTNSLLVDKLLKRKSFKKRALKTV